jgi:hypothetical protein
MAMAMAKVRAIRILTILVIDGLTDALVIN